MRRYKNLFAIFCLVMISFFLVASASAALVPCGGEGQAECQLCHLWQLFNNIVNFAIFNIAVPGSVLLFAASGIMYLTSGGDPSRISRAKQIWMNTIIGLVIIFASWMVVNTLMNTLGSNAQGVIWAWNKFPPCP